MATSSSTSAPAAPPKPPTPPAPTPAAPTSPPAATAPSPPGPGVTPPPAKPGPAAAKPVQPAAAKPGPAQPAASAATEAPTGPGAVTPAAVQPQAVKPGATKTRPATKKAASVRTINPGDKICGQCGEGNDPARKFCRRCGASIVEATVFKLPWYKAFWRRLTTRKQKQAGARPKMRRRLFGSGGGVIFKTLRILVLLAIIVVVVLSFIGPWHKSLKAREKRYYHDVIGLVHPTYTPYYAHDAEATSSAPGHPAINLVDGAKNTSWQSNNTTKGQKITIHFPGNAKIAKVGFDIGDQDTPSSYQTEPRPQTLLLDFGGLTHQFKTVHLRDVAGFQTFTITARPYDVITITIDSVYAATGSGQNISIAQIEFFTKSS